LCATATESNQDREYDPAINNNHGFNNPTLGRALTPKDPAEGYGMINVDAAIQCLRRVFNSGGTGDTFGNGGFDKRASGCNVVLTNGIGYAFELDVPAGADFDLYLYSATPDPLGNPVILAASTSPTLGGTESFSYTPPAGPLDPLPYKTYYLVVKRVSGSGTFILRYPPN